jgi:murein DD-endopeptidase MepM/ murein hydrolase activator NlpD
MLNHARRIARLVPLAGILVLGTSTGSLPQDVTILARLAPPEAVPLGTAAMPPDTAEAPSPADSRVLVVRRGDTLARLLSGAGVAREEAEAALTALTALFPARALQPGHELTLHQAPDEDAALLALALEPEPGRVVTVTRGAEGWTAQEIQAEQRRHLVLAQGEVRGGLFDALRTAGLPPPLALGLIGALSHEVDFQRDLQPGDHFSVLFERFRDPEGEVVRHGEVLHAAFDLSGRHLSLWRHETEAGGAEWFDDTGQSLRRSFLRTPLDGARVTSGFGPREHPVLGFTRMHRGVDFAAPAGTPVFAAADGVVVSAGRAGGYGRMVRLRHANGTETRYAHLSAFARGLRAGGRVRQGEVIGRVGSSGLSTGPHLHYEVAERGRPVDPATLRAEAGTRLAGPELAAFTAARRQLQAQLARLEPRQEVAAAD